MASCSRAATVAARACAAHRIGRGVEASVSPLRFGCVVHHPREYLCAIVRVAAPVVFQERGFRVRIFGKTLRQFYARAIDTDIRVAELGEKAPLEPELARGLAHDLHEAVTESPRLFFGIAHQWQWRNVTLI